MGAGNEGQVNAKINLNQIQPDFEDTKPFATDIRSGDIEAFTADLAMRLIERIKRADFVCGCMAWFTHRDVLDALSMVRHGCQVVVQKEDFIRPGIVGKGELQRMYAALKSVSDGYGLPYPGDQLDVCGSACESVDPVRCMGISNPDHQRAYPRMHHKFFVFCREGKRDPDDDNDRPLLVPYAVWTGSFNATQNAVNSRENAVYIENGQLARFFASEWARIYAISEPLNWTCHFVDDENAKRFGT